MQSIGVTMEFSSEITGAIAVGQSESGLQVPITSIFLAEYTEEKPLQACRACLLTDCRLYSMEKCNLKDMFIHLTGLQLLDDKYPSSLCAMCATFLVKCERFRDKSLIVQRKLSSLSNTTGSVTTEQIKQVYKKIKNLSSNLKVNKTTEIYVSGDYEEESPTNLKSEQIYTELTRDCDDNCIIVSSNSLVKQNLHNNFDSDIDVCDDDTDEEKEEEIPTGAKIKTEMAKGFEANLDKREFMKLSSNSSAQPNYSNIFDTYIYKEEIPIDIHGKQLKTELESANEENVTKRELIKSPSELSVKEISPYFSDTPYIVYTYENYEENTTTTTTLNNELLPIELLSDSDENDNDKIKTESNHEQVGVNIIPIELLSDSDENDNDKIKTETNHEQVEVKVSKEINEIKRKVEFIKAGGGSKPALKTAKIQVKKNYKCEQCAKFFNSKSVLLAHLRLEHHSKQQVCCLCGLSFLNRRCLRRHQKLEHLSCTTIPDDGPCCPECSVRFLSEEALQTHLHGTLKDTSVSAKHNYSEFGEDLKAEISDSPENREEKVNNKKVRTKSIKKSVPTRKCKSKRTVPIDQKRIILNNMIVVKKLTLEEQLEVIQKRKDRNENKTFECDICSFGTYTKKILETHMVKHSEEMGQFSCDLCHFRFKKSRTYHRHKLRHSFMYSCVECPFTTYLYHFASKHVLQFHERKKFICDKCGKVYRSRNSYFMHKRIKHPSSEHVCCLCGYSFVSTTGLLTHHKAKHLQESIEIPKLTEGPSCAECSLRFVNEKALQTHMGVSHATGTDEKIINSAETNSTYLHARRKVICETCGNLVNPYHLKAHLEWHAGKTFPCPICDKIYPTKSGMAQHKFFTHGKGKEYKLKANKSGVKKDERTECKVCRKTFSNPANVKKHMIRIHSGTVVHCKICNKQFPCSDNLKSHVDHVHLKKPWYRNRAR